MPDLRSLGRPTPALIPLACLVAPLALSGLSEDELPTRRLLLLLAVLPALYLGGLVHEAGHALLGRWAGFEVSSFGLGVARPFWVGRWDQTWVYLARAQPLQGITFSVHPSLFPPRGLLLALLAGGAVAQGAFALVALAAWWAVPWGRPVWGLVALVNGAVALLNLVPLAVRVRDFVFHSDGALMLRVLRRGGLETPTRDLAGQVAGLRGLWADVGDGLAPRVWLLGLAVGWLELEVPEAARQAVEEAEALPGTPPPWLEAYQACVKGWVTIFSGDLAEAGAALERAERWFAGQANAGGLFLVSLARVDLLRAGGQSEAALGLLAALLDHPLAASRRYLREELEGARLTIQARLPGADLPALEERFRELGRLPLPWERAFHLALARAAAARGDAGRAAAAFRAAIAAARRLGEGWPEAAGREVFLRAQEG